jgi:hypothetical protein
MVSFTGDTSNVAPASPPFNLISLEKIQRKATRPAKVRVEVGRRLSPFNTLLNKQPEIKVKNSVTEPSLQRYFFENYHLLVTVANRLFSGQASFETAPYLVRA